MKQHKIFAAAAAAMLFASAAVSASAADEPMTFRIDAKESAVCLDNMTEDAVLKGDVFIDNYTGLTSLRLILKSDDPIVIKNGDYTRDPAKFEPTTNKNEEPKHLQLLFPEHDQADYFDFSNYPEDKPKPWYYEYYKNANIVLWYAKNSSNEAIATAANPDSSFVHFDIRVPKSTKPGDYKCYISEEVITNPAGQKEEDFFAYCGAKQLVLDQNVKLAPLDVAVYMIGDTNLDGTVDVQDAQTTLIAYTEGIAGNDPKLTKAQIMAADVVKDGKVSVDDAQVILKYYTEKVVAGKKDTTWEQFLG